MVPPTLGSSSHLNLYNQIIIPYSIPKGPTIFQVTLDSTKLTINSNYQIWQLDFIFLREFDTFFIVLVPFYISPSRTLMQAFYFLHFLTNTS